MKKFIFLLCLLGLFLVGCGSDENTPGDIPTEETVVPPTITETKQPTEVIIDISGVVMVSKEVTYDGEEHYLECSNVPDGVYVDYENNWQTEVGTYKVIAILSNSKGEELGRLEATLVIIESKDEIDISGVVFLEFTCSYNGYYHYLECNNIPDEITVKYEGNGVKEVGVHEVVAILFHNGLEVGRLTSTITINENPLLLAVSDLSIDEYGVVSWSYVEGATHYNYMINGREIKTTTLNTITLLDGQTISIQAANDTMVEGVWSEAITYYDTKPHYEDVPKEIYVKFHNTNLPSEVLLSGNKVSKPADPVKANYIFDNWYADPFYQVVFDFNTELYESTVIYANYTPIDLIKDTYFWVKGNPLISGSIMSSGTSSNWHFIPMKENTKNQNYKEFYTTVTVTGASQTNPAAFIVMDGFSDDSGRTYWKNGTSDFTIYSDGVYNIYFSTEHQYAANIHIYVEASNNSSANLAYAYQDLDLSIPVLSLDTKTDICSWNCVEGAIGYEVIVNNEKAIYTTDLGIKLEKGSHITVRAVADGKYSRWSMPKANIEVIYVEDTPSSYSVYFSGYDAYQVEPNTMVVAPSEPSKDGFSFGGWYLDYNCTVAAQFPYLIEGNTVFYAKWVSIDDYANKVYYNLILEDGTVVKGLTWNLDNYSFDEYESGAVNLSINTNYYIVSTSDSTVKYGPYTVNADGGYKIYFSEDYTWDGGHIYIAATTKTIYVTNNKRWTDTIYAYVWDSSSNTYFSAWPGIELTYVETNSYGEKIYKFDVDISKYDMVIFSHGTLTNGKYQLSSQTIDLKLSDYTTNAFYFTEKDTSGKYQVGTWNK